MCAPLAIAAAAAAVTSAASQVVSASAQDRQAKETWENDKTDLLNKYSATQAQEQQMNTASAARVIQAQNQGMSMASRVRVSAAAGNVSGASANEREAEPGNAVSNFVESSKINLANQLAQSQLDAQGFQARAKSIINENPTANPAALDVALGKDVVGGVEGALGAEKPGERDSGSTAVNAVKTVASAAAPSGDMSGMGADVLTGDDLLKKPNLNFYGGN